MNVNFVDLRAQDAPIRDKLDQAVAAVLDKGNFILGEDVTQFEEEFAAFCGTSYAVGVNSGLSALQLTLIAHGIGPGDEVIIPAHTFVATAAAVTFAGARPVLVDIAPDTYNLDVTQIAVAITPRTKAIMPVHLYGRPADMEPIMALAQAHNLIVVEDAAQAHGAVYHGKRTGSLGHAAGFSFYPAKNLGASGDSGIVVTSDAGIAGRIRALRNCGQFEKNRHDLAPYNCRMDTIQAAMLRVRLTQLDTWNTARRQHARLYNALLAGSSVKLPLVDDDSDSTAVWHLYVIRVAERDALRAYLSEHGIGTGIHYPLPVHLQPVYKSLGYRAGDFPVAERCTQQVLSLPMHPHLTREEIEYVAGPIMSFLAR
ncbi:MAG: DegT/DnrJ/EryC1/StrS family aminotransferase [Anaerolineae bacterium]|nr:DegT/DnrJ/EryC1/StrS family aminotransferase [Anaerolineae bacterium]